MMIESAVIETDIADIARQAEKLLAKGDVTGFQEFMVTFFGDHPSYMEQVLTTTYKQYGAALADAAALEIGGEAVDGVDAAAAAIGAVNTIVHRGGRLAGANTDAAGAVAALAEKTDLSGRRAVVVGAGGVARALVYGLREEGARVTVVNRGRERGERLARDLTVDFRPLGELDRLSFDLLVNATPVGMHPKTDACPVDPARLPAETVVMDTVYTPRQTRLLQRARARGCTVVDGLTMFVHQGAAQFELWTGRPAPFSVMEKAARGPVFPGGPND